MAHPNCSLLNAIDLPEIFTWSNVEKIIILAFIPLVTFFGNAGNLAFLFTGVRVPRMRTVANMYLFNLAVSDVLLLSTVCAAYLWTYVASSVVRTQAYVSAIWCWVIIYPSSICYFASVEMVTLVSFERYYAICHPLKHRSFAGKQRTKKQIAGCWVAAAILAAFVTFKVGDIQSVTLCVSSIAGGLAMEPHFLTISYCMNPFGYVWFSLIGEIIIDALFLAGLISSSFTYVKVIQALIKREVSNLQSNQDNLNNKVRQQIAITLIINGIIFFVCQIPYRVHDVHNITATFKIWSLRDDELAKLTVVYRIFLYINSAINPYIYILGSKYYRQAFKEAFGFKMSAAGTRSTVATTVTRM